MNATHQISSIPISLTTENNSSNGVLGQGILTSNYKEKAMHSLRNTRTSSLFGLKRRIRKNQQQLTSVTGTILKVSIFVIAYLIAFF